MRIQNTLGGNFAQLGGSICDNHFSNITIVNCTFDETYSKHLTWFGGCVAICTNWPSISDDRRELLS